MTTPHSAFAGRISHEQFEAQLAELERHCTNPQAGLFGPDSMMWEINKYPLAVMQGSGRALLLQLAHPWITNAVDEHSHTRHDLTGRGKRTFTHVGRMVFGSLDQALDSARRVYRLHQTIHGELRQGSPASPAGQPYQATDVAASLWVNATLWHTAAQMYECFVRALTADEKERYYQETRRFAWLFGIPDASLPSDWQAFDQYCQRMFDGPHLQVNANTRELVHFLFHPQPLALRAVMVWMRPFTALSMPERLRRDFALEISPRTQRWVMRTVALF